MGFKGFPASAIEFFTALAEDNTREFWAENRSVHESTVKAPLVELCRALEDEFGSAELFRPHRDTRFAKDKSPYRTFQGAVVATDGGCGYYVEISATGLRTAGGYYAHGSDQVMRYRDAVDDEDSGEELVDIVKALRRRGLSATGNALRTQPRGYAQDHPRVELLRQRDLVFDKSHGLPKWLHTARVLDRVRADWNALRPLNEWLDEHVGVSERQVNRWRP